MSDIQSRSVTDQMALTVDALEGVKKANADYCAKLTALHKANQHVQDPAGVLTSLLPRAIKEAEKDAAQRVQALEEIVAETPLVAKDAVRILRDFEMRVDATRKAGTELVKNFVEQVESNDVAVIKASDLREELRDASEAVVNLECMLGEAAASVLNAFEAATRCLGRLADGCEEAVAKLPG